MTVRRQIIERLHPMQTAQYVLHCYLRKQLPWPTWDRMPMKSALKWQHETSWRLSQREFARAKSSSLVR
jgi:hypothetical protein